MAKVHRIQFLQALEAVRPGLSKETKFEQSTCFVFLDGKVYTYNDEISCIAKSGLPKKMVGVVEAKPLLEVLNKLKEEDIEVEIDDDESKFLITGKSRRWAKLRLDAEIELPVEKVERPEKEDWHDLHERFGEAIATVQECAGTDESKLAFTCIHLHNKWIEACDNNQLTRFRIKTRIKQPVMVRRDSIKHIIPLDMTEFAETNVWIHFRNPGGVQLACKRRVEKYPKLDEYLKASGEPTVLPKGIADDAEFSEIFSKEVKDGNLVVVTLKPGRMELRGVGVSGEAGAPKKVKYNGPKIAFSIAPKLLGEITKRHTECQISKDYIRVDGDKWTYVSCLKDPRSENKRAEDAAEAAALEQEDPGETEERDNQWEDD